MNGTLSIGGINGEGSLPMMEDLADRGVEFPSPRTVSVGAEVRPERIAPGVVIHSGCRIHGASTSVGPGSELGREQPLTIENCQLGYDVSLKGGYVADSTFLDGVSIGSGAHVRAGSLLEECASVAHSVGLKQTILFPFVTLGSLINFCDCFMSGGSSGSNHSEVGSGYVHFNFTPHGDKATASLIGDVARGVMLDQDPIFLGGQGGLVGPSRIEYGTMLPAGCISRRDILVAGHLITPEPYANPAGKPYMMGMYRDIRRRVENNLLYLGNIRALQHWYGEVRVHVMARDPYREACHEGAMFRLDTIFRERMHRLDQLVGKLPRSMELLREKEGQRGDSLYSLQESLVQAWPQLQEQLNQDDLSRCELENRDLLRDGLIGRCPGVSSWLDVVQSLDFQGKQAGTTWLQAIVDRFSGLWHGNE